MPENQPVLIIMAAGMGSRFGRLKQIESVTSQNEKIIDFSIYDAMRAGFRRVIFVIKQEIEQDFRQAIGDRISRHITVDYAFQRQDDLPAGVTAPAGRVKPYGTGHAILAARQLIDAPFAVINADDYYGPGAFQLVYDHLCAISSGQAASHVMIAYRLDQTISEHGSVSRGICQIDSDGYLASIVERTRIEHRGAGLAYLADDGQTWQPIPDDTRVSMNIWGFSAGFLSFLAAEFARFCTDQLPENPVKAEFYLNAVVNSLILRGLARVKIATTPDIWYGITYPEDKDKVSQAFRMMKENGLYPERLWAEPGANDPDAGDSGTREPNAADPDARERHAGDTDSKDRHAGEVTSYAPH